MTCQEYHQTSNINHTLVGNKLVDSSDVVGALPVGAASTAFSFSTQHTFKFWNLVQLILEV